MSKNNICDVFSLSYDNTYVEAQARIISEHKSEDLGHTHIDIDIYMHTHADLQGQLRCCEAADKAKRLLEDQRFQAYMIWAIFYFP